ncbi:MAG: tetratricopeptide repeat protein [Azospirillaceae bacterium]
MGVGWSRWILAGLLAVVLGALATPSPVAAQVDPGLTAAEREALEQEQRDLFQRMLADPADLDTTFAYARVSTRLGDIEAAITALERMLILAPDLPRVKLELGVLYYRLESYDIARAYLEDAIAGEDVPDAVRERVEVFLGEIEDRQARHALDLTATGGVRYQTNANLGPASRDVTIRGFELELRPEDTEQEDVNLFAALGADYRYDLESQGDAIEASAIAYATRQFEQHQVDSEVIEVSVGPRFDLRRFGLAAASVSPYALANHIRLDREGYLVSLGGGVEGDVVVADPLRLEAGLEARWRDFLDTDTSPLNSQRDGWRYSARTAATWRLTPRLALLAEFDADRVDARAAYESAWSIGGGGGFRLLIDPPIGVLPWRASATGAYRYTRYDEPDPFITADERQRDREIVLRAALAVPLARDVDVGAQVERRSRTSNYDIEAFDNIAVTAALTVRF